MDSSRKPLDYHQPFPQCSVGYALIAPTTPHISPCNGYSLTKNFIEHLLCTKHYSRHYKYSTEKKKKKADLKPNCLGSNPSLASYQLCDLGGYLLFASGFFICKMKITIPIFHEVMRIKLPLLSHSSGVAYFLRQKQSWHIQTAEMGWSTGSE